MKNVVLVVLGVAVTIFILPFLNYWLAYFGGWITEITIGDTLVDALNTLFGTTRFNAEMIPKMAGALGWIGSYFKTYSAATKR